MANPRVHEIANELGIDSKIALAKLTEMGEFVKSASSSIAPPVARRLKKALEEDGVAKPAAAPARAHRVTRRRLLLKWESCVWARVSRGCRV